MQEVSDLLLQCLHQDPGQRPTALELMQRLEPLMGPPKHPLPAASSTRSSARVQVEGPAVRPPMRVSVPPPSMPSPFAALAAIALPSQQQQQVLSPFAEQTASGGESPA